MPMEKSESWVVNPLLQTPFLPWLIIPNGDRWGLPTYDSLELLDWTSTPRREWAFLRPDASWRRMFLIQPPPKKLSVVSRGHTREGDSSSELEVVFDQEQPPGVTMDALYDIPLMFLRSHWFSRFALEIKAPTSPSECPTMTLYLLYTIQCTTEPFPGDLIPSRKDLRSRASRKWEVKDEDLWEGELVYHPDIIFQSDLTPERGGIRLSDFAEWTRKRVPISSLLADVR
ncbi:uncharacterized protein BDR25DRAFT_301471 [Lindgomyces ingoldianus]|uniref:Uncharacterized protein n=1 Tax=Lindgomyces ingoldianus TaxID=673940 RepID=A0ACB6R6H9_9PLEO|nr:uncharacterized protein BDR25DRAFT_301471 [Lindgomyces ingoldianus]KAF2474869.1 hypothetical protein BDR25DRAFT_301471 [Lindgomyces ingoldianus]